MNWFVTIIFKIINYLYELYLNVPNNKLLDAAINECIDRSLIEDKVLVMENKNVVSNLNIYRIGIFADRFTTYIDNPLTNEELTRYALYTMTSPYINKNVIYICNSDLINKLKSHSLNYFVYEKLIGTSYQEYIFVIKNKNYNGDYKLLVDYKWVV